MNTFIIVIDVINAAIHRTKLIDLNMIPCLLIKASIISNKEGIAKNTTWYQIQLYLLESSIT